DERTESHVRPRGTCLRILRSHARSQRLCGVDQASVPHARVPLFGGARAVRPGLHNFVALPAYRASERHGVRRPNTSHDQLQAEEGGTLRRLLAAAVIACAACRAETSQPPGEYLFFWAGDSAAKASDFLAVIDAAPSSRQYGSVVASLPTGVPATHPHHTASDLTA